MLRIRLQRAGRKNLPHYRIVLAEHSAPVKGRFIEKLGHYDPRSKAIGLKKEAILGWIGKGAKPSNTAARLLLGQGVKHKNIEYIKRKPKLAKQNQEKPKTDLPAQAGTPVVEEPKVVENKDNPPAGGKE